MIVPSTTEAHLLDSKLQWSRVGRPNRAMALKLVWTALGT